MKKFMKKHIKLWIVLGIIIVLVIAGFFFVKSSKKKIEAAMAAMNVKETAQVERRELVSSIAANGKVVAADKKDVKVNLSGVEFATVDVEEGDIVHEGDLVCTFDVSTIEMQMENLEKTLSASQATASLNVSQAKRMLEEAEANRDVAAEQADIDIANAWQDYLRSLTDVETAEDKYYEAQQTAGIKNGELARVEENIDSLEDAEIKFARVRGQMQDYMSLHNISSTGAGGIAIASDEWTYLAATQNTNDSKLSDFMYTDGTVLSDADMDAINDYLRTLKNIHGEYTEYLTNTSSASAELSSWKSKAESAESTEETLKSSYENAIKTAQNYYRVYEQKLRDKNSTRTSSDSAVATKEDSLKSAQISAGTAGLSEKERLAGYEKSLEKYQVYAPISGTVTSVNYEVGQSYGGTDAILTIEDKSSYQVSAEIEEYDIGRIEIGQRVVIKTNGTGDDELEGKLVEIAEHATSGSTSATTYNVKIDILTKNDALRLDMTAKISVITDEIPNALTVPYDAVQTDDDGKDYVEVVDDTTDFEEGNSEVVTSFVGEKGAAPMPQDNARKVYITRGAESDYYIEIHSDELKEGDTVIVVNKDSNNDLFGMGPMGGF